MSRRVAWWLGLFCFELVWLGLTGVSGAGSGNHAGGHERTFEFVYTTRIERGPGPGRTLELWIPYPQSGAHQEVRTLAIDAPVKTSLHSDPKYGNRILHLSLPGSLAFPLRVRMRFLVRRREYSNRASASSLTNRQALPPKVARFLEPSTLVPLNDQIRSWAAQVAAGRRTDLEKARAVYDYAVTHLRYQKSGRGWGRGDLLYVCDARHGNCTDFHALFIGYCRALGIPARFSIGFPLPRERGAGPIEGYHCWAEFYLRGRGWVPVDASEAFLHPDQREYFFGALDENRILFSRGRDILLDPPQAGAPLNYFVYPYGEVEGRPFKGIRYLFSFRDLSPAAPLQSGR